MPKKLAVKNIRLGSKLDDRQVKFCEEYLVDFNATRAAKAAGYAEKTATTQASDLLRRPHIQAEIKSIAQRLMEETGDPKKAIIAELQMIAFGDMRDFMKWTDNRQTWKDSDSLGEKSRLIQEISETHSATGGSRKIKLYDKLKALEMLSKYYGLYKDQVEHSGEVTTKVIIAIPSNGRERN